MQGGWHKFIAPIDGVKVYFAMRCEDGVPKHLCCSDAVMLTRSERVDAVARQLDAVNKLLRQPGFWDCIKLQRQGDIGAVIEAAEARPVEIYERETAT